MVNQKHKIELTPSKLHFALCPSLSWEAASFESPLKEGKGLDPFTIHPSAKNDRPAKMAVPHAWEYHLLYCLIANLHCSLSVAGSGFAASGGFGYRTLWLENLVLVWPDSGFNLELDADDERLSEVLGFCWSAIAYEALVYESNSFDLYLLQSLQSVK